MSEIKHDNGPWNGKHDPGPWRWSRTYEIGEAAYWCLENDESAAEGKTIDASIILRLNSDNWLGSPFLDNPNARLIAAAPELLEAVQAFLDAAPSNGSRCFYCDAQVYGANDLDDHSPDCEIEKARAVVAKAQG